jgi:hypothetical protein
MGSELSLAELNAIAAEFSVKPFEPDNSTPPFSVWTSTNFHDVREALADRCEELGSRWCECLRDEAHLLRGIYVNRTFTLVD